MLAVSIVEGIDGEHLKQVYADPHIKKTGHDHRAAEPVIHPLATYLSAFVDGSFVGAFLAIRQSPIEIDVHSLLLRPAVRYSRELGLLFLQWAFSSPILRVTAYVVDGLKTVVNYCLKIGFKHEGYRRNACVKDGVPIGVNILGITREDWKDYGIRN